MNKHLIRRTLPVLLSAALVMFAGCKADSVQTDDSLQKVLDKKEFVLGLDANYPPMGFTDENGELVGFDLDVAQEVCNRLGVSLVKHPIDWEEKENELNNGTIDCIWNALSVTQERAEAMNLSEPYMRNELIFMVHESSSAKSVSDLAGRSVGVQSGSTAQEALKDSSLFAEITMVEYPDNIQMLHDLTEGRLDAGLIDSVAAYYYIARSEDRFFVLPDSFGEESLAIGFRKKDQALRDKVQETVSEMKADGTLGEISVKWFGNDITIVK